MATTIPEAVTTIPAGTLRLLPTSISYRAKARKEMWRKPPMVPRRPPRSCCWTAPPVGACQADPVPEYKPPGAVGIETPPGWHGLRYIALSGMDP